MNIRLPFAIVFAFAIFSTLTLSAQLQPIAYSDGPQKLNGLAIKPKNPGKKKPGVVILPAWKGIDDNAKLSAEKLAALGYFAFVADIYGEGNYPTDAKSAGERAGYYKKNVAEYQKRVKLAIGQLLKAGADPDNIFVIGYCFGGTGALEAARAGMPVKGVVSFHGGLGRDASREILPINAKVLVLHGADDPYAPEAEIKAFQDEMRKAKADWQMIYYANAVHAFTEPTAGNDNSKGVAYNEKAANRSWKAMLQFFDELVNQN